jgi:hypothetical protein
MKRCATSLTAALATGYILFFFSERLFWTVWWPGSSLVDFVVTWLAYSAIGYLFLAVVYWFRVDDLWSVYLAGAVYGWLVEGGLADTLYGTQPSAPLPISIVITGLSWHALISVLIGWWATGKALAAERAQPLVWLCVSIGIFWGIWAMFPRRETPPIVTPVSQFLANAILLTLALMAAWWIRWRAAVRITRQGSIGLTVSASVVGLFYVTHIAALGLRPIVLLPTVLCVALVPLYFHRGRRVYAPVRLFNGELRSPRLLLMGLIPLVATLVYAAAAAAGLDRLPWLAPAIYALTGVAGFVMLVISIVMILRNAFAQERKHWQSWNER